MLMALQHRRSHGCWMGKHYFRLRMYRWILFWKGVRVFPRTFQCTRFFRNFSQEFCENKGVGKIYGVMYYLCSFAFSSWTTAVYLCSTTCKVKRKEGTPAKRRIRQEKRKPIHMCKLPVSLTQSTPYGHKKSLQNILRIESCFFCM